VARWATTDENAVLAEYANRFTLPKAEKLAGINTMEKYCTYCKKAGHKREDCWSLNGHPGKKRTTRKKKSKRGSHIKTKDEQVMVRKR